VIQFPFQPRILETARSIYCRFPTLSTDASEWWCSREETDSSQKHWWITAHSSHILWD